MVYVISHPAVLRDRPKLTVTLRGMAFVLSAVAVGLATGAAYGFAGSRISSDTRTAISVAAAFLFAVIGAAEITGRRRVPLPQLSRETTRRYGEMTMGSVIRNGTAMGAGVATRIGFWLWYVVPVAAILSGTAVRGAIVFGVYSFTRGVAPLLLILTQPGQWRHFALVQRRIAQRAAAVLSILSAGGFVAFH
jgi:hypothetical protein